jgi:DNA-binding winged helix-turn-helix (wHTH) protein
MADQRAVGQTWYFPGHRFEGTTGQLWRDPGAEVPLRRHAAAILALLLECYGEVVPKRDLLSVAWPEGFVGEGVLAVTINELRRALGDDPRQPRYIATIHRRGYRFVAPVSVRPHAAGEQGSPGSVPFDASQRPLVGRDDDIAALNEFWRRARRGERQLVFVAAPAGVGKTRLVDAFVADLAGDGPLVVGRGRCLGSGEAYFPLLDALSDMCRGIAGHRVRDVLRAVAPTWVLQLPALVDAADLEQLRLQTSAASPARMRELCDALDALAAWRATLVVCEDLHDGDSSTTELLSYLARRRAPSRLMVVGTYRRAEAAARSLALRPVVQDLRARGLCGFLPLGMLLAAVVDYLVEHGVLEERDGLLHCPTGLDRLGIPDGARQLIERQIDGLDEADRALLEVSSAVGLEFTAAAVNARLGGQAADLSGLEERFKRLEERSGLISAAGAIESPDGAVTARYRFAHAMQCEVLSSALGGIRTC